MANVLQFALGLSGGNFLSTAAMAKVATAGLAAAATVTGIALAGMMGAITRGGALVDLSNRTREGVASLFQLQHAFKQGGAEAAAVGPVINALQRSLSGTNEAGEKTDAVFAGLGTSIKELRGMSSGDALQKIFAGLRGLEANSAAGAAGKIFGRGISASILTLSNDTEGFNQALGESAKTAEVFARHAAAFDRLGDTFETIRMRAQGFFAGVAGGLTPAMQSITDALASIDVEGLGTRLGTAFSGIAEGIRQQRIGELFGLALQSGVQDASDLMLTAIIKWGDAYRGEMNADGSQKPGFWSKLGAGTLGVGQGLLGIWDEVGANLGVPGAQGLADQRIDQAMANFDFAGIGDGALTRVADAMVAGVEGRKNEYAEKLAKLFEELQADAAKRAAQGVTTPAPAGQKTLDLNPNEEKKAAAVSAPRVDSDGLQRIGFFSRDRASDPNVETARETRLSRQLLFKISERLERFDGRDSNFANA